MTDNSQNGSVSPQRAPRPTIPLREIPVVQEAHPETSPEREFQHLLDWVGQGVAAMEGIDNEETRQQVFALLDGIDLVHRQGLQRVLDMIDATGGQSALPRITEDPIVRTLLEMYDLLPVSERDQVEQALEPVYSYIESHGGRLEFLDVQDGRVTVRLSGSCGSCPGSAGTLQRVVEEALRDGFPAFTELVAEPPPSPKRSPIQFGPTVLRQPRWVDVGTIEDFPEEEMRALWPEGQGVLLVRLDGEVYAHQNGCPAGSALTLHLGELDHSTLICPWHGCRYDIRTGKRLDGEGKLGVLPVAVQDGRVKIAMGVEEIEVP
jgi:nitrite reductase/ring-hydroxylating ferredoxin subunit/Fe-S cluster biogenesis protein NfuA